MIELGEGTIEPVFAHAAAIVCAPLYRLLAVVLLAEDLLRFRPTDLPPARSGQVALLLIHRFTVPGHLPAHQLLVPPAGTVDKPAKSIALTTVSKSFCALRSIHDSIL